MGRNTFTQSEIQELRRLILEKQMADRSRQKSLRARMRTIGFYISDFSADSAGFVASDLDDLITRGVITVSDDEPDAAVEPPAGVGASRGPRRSPSDAQTDARQLSRGSKIEHDSLVRDAASGLASTRALPIAEMAGNVPRRPGLYAIHAPADVWIELGLEKPPDARPLYVGKAEASLVSRDVDTHFGNGRTGSSTVRRSFAALLRELLELEGRPRNPSKPERPANYGLLPEHDERLTSWMRSHLELAVWPKPMACALPLVLIENALLQKLEPPLNIKDVVTPWTLQVKAARKVLADQARRWMHDR